MIRAFVFLLFAALAVTGVPLRTPQQQPPHPAVVPAPRTDLAPKSDKDHPYNSVSAQLLVEKDKNIQLQYQLMQASFQTQQSLYQQQYGENEKKLGEWIASVRKANGWGDDVQYDRDQDKWYRPGVPVTPPPPPAAAPAVPAKAAPKDAHHGKP